MFESKYSKVLTIILVIVILAIVVLLGLLGYDWYQKYFIEQEAAAFAENYEQEVNTADKEDNDNSEGEEIENPLDQLPETSTNQSPSTNTSKPKALPQYKGFGVLGRMVIPATNFDYPILEKVTKKSIETAVAYLDGVGVNKVGNTVIIGHNYRNGLFFSNNKKLKVGDQIFITDNDGNRLTYTIYNKFETTANDISFYRRDTNGKAEITLSTCSDDSSTRLIIFAKAE